MIRLHDRQCRRLEIFYHSATARLRPTAVAVTKFGLPIALAGELRCSSSPIRDKVANMALDVLLADRDELLVSAYEAFLVGEGFRVATVTSGIECLRVIRLDPPRLLVLDPGLLWGGPGVLAVLCEEAACPPVPVLVLTDKPSEVLLELMTPYPSAVVLKPLAPAALASLVRSLKPSSGSKYSTGRARPTIPSEPSANGPRGTRFHNGGRDPTGTTAR